VGRVASPVFVGRAYELAALDDALETATNGTPSTVLIGGDAGVGKTRLLSTWNQGARERGVRVALGACLDLGERGPAYVAIVQALRHMFQQLEPTAIQELVGSDRSTLARVIPELLAEEEAHDGGRRSGPMAQTRLFDRLVGLIDRASSAGPLAFELEDIHWADPSTRAFLQYLVANSSAPDLLVIATFRTDEAGREHPLASVLRQLDRDPAVSRINLQPFDVDELREQLHGILGELPTDRLLAAINARSEGNALFAEELVATGEPQPDLPSSIGAALLSRTEVLSRDTQLALRVAAVAGRTVSYHVLRSATALPDDRLGDALRAAVAANILEPEHAGERYRFRHALLQEAIYEDALPGERRRLHAAVAKALEVEPRDLPNDPELAPQLAHHWFEAKDNDRALAASIVAGDAAVRQLAFAEGLEHYERVLDLWSTDSESRVGLSLAEVLVRASHVAWNAGEPEKTVSLGRRALEELGETGDRVLRVRALDEVARALDDIGRFGEATTYAELLGGTDVDGLPLLEQMIVRDYRVQALRWQGDRAAAIAAALDAVRFADATDDPELMGDAHGLMAWALYDSRDIEGSIREAILAHDLASKAGDAETAFFALSVVHQAHLEAGENEMAIGAARAARIYGEQAGLSRSGGSWASNIEARALLHLGRLRESALVVEAALLDVPADRGELVLHTTAALVFVVRGMYDAAASQVEGARMPGASADEENGRVYLALARAELARAEGRLDDVRAIVDAAAPLVPAIPTFSDMSNGIWQLVEIGLDVIAAQVEAERAAGDLGRIADARADAGTLIGYVDDVRRQRDADGVRDTGRHRGDEALIAGHLARIEGRDDPALWSAAADAFPPGSPRGLGARYRQAEAMLATRAPRDEIAEVMSAAHAVAVDIGAGPVASRFEALARRARIGLRVEATVAPTNEAIATSDEPPAPGSVALHKRGLSDREIEVLTLVASGLSNQNIADRLFISSKTASVHVSHILDKLGVSTRTEAATIGVRLGLPEVDTPHV
jgi:DNA-binding CsgD family transcriptional regulator/tetratricopeptide (TPR) repeat protein